MIKQILSWILSKFKPKRDVRNTKKYKLNILPDAVDERDYLQKSTFSFYTPMVLDYSEFVTVKQQGVIGSCGSHAACTGMEMINNLNNAKWPIEFSELFHYWVVRQPEFFNTFPRDSGQNGRNAVAVMLKYGSSPESLMPYIASNYNISPDAFCLSFAKFWKIKQYERCYDITGIKTALNEKKAVWLGIPVQNSIFANKGEVINFKIGTAVIGGHAMCVVGYNDDKQVLKVVNSWGPNWGTNGFGLISYDYLDKCSWFDAWSFGI